MSDDLLNRSQVLRALKDVAAVPSFGRNVGRTIYEIAGPPGHFHIDYASFDGGVTGEVPRNVIDELETEGLIVRKYPDPKINMWVLR